MIEKDYRSKCCNAKVKTGGVPDFIGSKEVYTVHFICLKCNKACDTVMPIRKRIKDGEKRLNFQGKALQKLVEFFDGIKIHPIKGIILTPKKKRQLVEFQKMEQKLFKSKINK